MARITVGSVEAAAVRTSIGKCFSDKHAECQVTHYKVPMIMTQGSDKAHSVWFTVHSAEPTVLLRGSNTGCGSKRNGIDWVAAGRFAPVVTCGRCEVIR